MAVAAIGTETCGILATGTSPAALTLPNAQGNVHGPRKRSYRMQSGPEYPR